MIIIEYMAKKIANKVSSMFNFDSQTLLSSIIVILLIAHFGVYIWGVLLFCLVYNVRAR